MFLEINLFWYTKSFARAYMVIYEVYLFFIPVYENIISLSSRDISMLFKNYQPLFRHVCLNPFPDF